MSAVSASIRTLDFGQPSSVIVAELVGEFSEEQWMLAQSWFSNAEANRYSSETVGRAERFLAGRYLIRAAMSELFETAPLDVVVRATCSSCGQEHGAPQATIRDQKIFLSLSHSGEHHVVALSTEVFVGVDVEVPRPEMQAGFGIEDWTRTESIAKVGGRGLLVPSLEADRITTLGFAGEGFVGTLAWSRPVDF